MTATYTNGVVTVTKHLFIGWSVFTVYQDSSSPMWVPIKDLDKQTLKKVYDQLFNPIFPEELRAAVKTALGDEAPSDREDVQYPVTVVNSKENWDLISSTGVPWFADEETQSTMDAVFFKQEDLEIAKQALNGSSKAYPD